LTQVEPQTWQKSFKEAGEWLPAEEDSRQTALRLFPGHQHLFSRVKDHNSADAALMAVWGIRKFLAK